MRRGGFDKGRNYFPMQIVITCLEHRIHPSEGISKEKRIKLEVTFLEKLKKWKWHECYKACFADGSHPGMAPHWPS